jgi:hypothetical protein
MPRLQAADAAIGASKSAFICGVIDWLARISGPTDLKSNVRSVDFDSKSAKTDYVRVQSNNIPRSGGAG